MVLFASDLAFNKAIREIVIVSLLEARLSWLKYLCHRPSLGDSIKKRTDRETTGEAGQACLPTGQIQRWLSSLKDNGSRADGSRMIPAVVRELAAAHGLK